MDMSIYNILYGHGRKAILIKNKCWMHLDTKFILQYSLIYVIYDYIIFI